jgi:hypothetical protein
MSFELEDVAGAPGFYDLYDAAEISWPLRVARRYFVPKNYERSLKIHEALGSKVLRGIVMKTAGRLRRERSESNYHIGNHGNALDRTANFAFKGSVFNEVVHGVLGAPAAMTSLSAILNEGLNPAVAIGTIPAMLNLGLVAVQRYNRARMIEFMDESLQSGETFTPGYHNWAGTDDRSHTNFVLPQAE